jgi:NADPH-dependent glutamate synthase beta subunit-like oxidoreductase
VSSASALLPSVISRREYSFNFISNQTNIHFTGMDELFDVAVIGAGMSGIILARDLSEKGHKVVVLEARDRLGGRTYMDHAYSGVLELGGGYVYWI